MANGRPFDRQAMTCAHRTWPLGSRVRVSSAGRSVVVTVTDRGPFVPGRILDLSEASFLRLAAGSGLCQARVELLR